MATTNAEELAERLKTGFNRRYHDKLYKLLCWAFGEKERAIAGGTGGGEFPDYPDVSPKEVAIGQSKKILNAQFIGLTRSMYGEPEPGFPDVDKYTEKVLQQFYLRRSRGETGTGYGQSEWQPQRSLAFLEGDGLGVGFLQVGLRTNKASAQQRVIARHVPATNVIWDPYVSSPCEATWICFVHNMDPDKARALYGAKNVDKGLRDVVDSGLMVNRKMFRVFEYYDLGIGKRDPTMALIPGDFANKPIALTNNPFGEFLPFAHYEHFCPPGAKRPIGRIMMQISSQETMNKIEAKIDKTVEDGDAADLIDLSFLDPDDVKALKAGQSPRFMRFARFNDGKPPFIRLPAREIAETVMQHYSMLDRQMTDDSGATDADRGLLSAQRRTLGENQIVEEKASTKASWSRMQAAKMERRLVEKVLFVAGLFDRDPVMVDVFGNQIMINNPQDPRSFIGNFLQQPSSVLIDESNLEFQDAQRKQAQRLANLEQLMPLVQVGVVDPHWMAIEQLKAIGEKDPESALMKAQPMMPGMPGPGMVPCAPMPPGGPGMPAGPGMPPGMAPSPGMHP